MNKVKVKLVRPCTVCGSGVIYRLPAGEVEVGEFLVELIEQQQPGAIDKSTAEESEDELESEPAPEIVETGNTDFDDMKSAVLQALRTNETQAFYSSSGKPKPSYFSRKLGRPVPRSMLEEAFEEVMRERGDVGE